MSTRTLGLSDELHTYLVHETMREPDVLRRLREETAGLEKANMQISPEQGRFMMLLVQLLDGRRAIEIGTFTGYSALCVASAMPPDGRLIACDVNAEWTTIARRYWEQAGVAEKIDLRLAPATETLDALLAENAAGTFDFAFIDADKPNLLVYYEKCVELVRPGGLVAVDNAFWKGEVANPAADDENTGTIRNLTFRARDDQRVFSCVVPIGDGLLLARKR